MDTDTDFRVIAVEIKYITAALDEMRREDLPAMRQDLRQAIIDETVPLEIRVGKLEAELRVIDKRVWVMFGAAALIVPTLVGAVVSFFLNGGG